MSKLTLVTATSARKGVTTATPPRARNGVTTTIHPDHLLDQARDGALSPEQWQQLGAHLATCATCAWEHSATADFAREQTSQEDLDAARLDALVGGALARAGLVEAKTAEAKAAEPSAPPAPPLPVSRPRPLGRWFAAAMVAAAVLGALALPSRDGSGAEPPVAVSDASLDAGAIGPPSGGDS
jgi:anti-sigma factor RsiW